MRQVLSRNRAIIAVFAVLLHPRNTRGISEISNNFSDFISVLLQFASLSLFSVENALLVLCLGAHPITHTLYK